MEKEIRIPLSKNIKVRTNIYISTLGRMFSDRFCDDYLKELSEVYKDLVPDFVNKYRRGLVRVKPPYTSMLVVTLSENTFIKTYEFKKLEQKTLA